MEKVGDIYLLTNIERQYLGLIETERHWKLEKITERCWVYYEEDNLRKIIEVIQEGENNTSYYERDLCVKTIENHTLAIGRKNQKVYKITPSYIRSLDGSGVYFFCSNRFICIGNFTSQKSFYTSLDEKIESLEDINDWVTNWVKETTKNDLAKLEIFKKEPRKHQKIKEGDFFRFQIGRREYGYGRVLLNIVTLRKNKELYEKLQGFHLLGTPLLIKTYKIITKNPDLTKEELRQLASFPSEYILDANLYYENYQIIGNIPLEEKEIDYPIQLIVHKNELFLQHGFRYKKIIEEDREKLEKLKNLLKEDYSFRTAGFYIHELYNRKSMKDMIEKDYVIYDKRDLRNPDLKEIKETLWKYFEW